MTRTLIDLFVQGALTNVRTLDIEPEYGYIGRIVYHDGTVRFFRGTNPGVNNHGASSVAIDKGYTNHFLSHLGYRVPKGKVFLMPDYLEEVQQNLGRYCNIAYAKSSHIHEYIKTEIGYPCFLKPNNGSKGLDIYKCFNDDEVTNALATYHNKQLNLVLVEESITLPDYRIIVYHHQVYCCYLRRPLALVGDGASTIADLMQQQQEQLQQTGRHTRIKMNDTRIHDTLKRHNLSFDKTLAAGEFIALHNISNLSAGGTAVDMTDAIHPFWQAFCIQVTADMGLTFCGVDIACDDITTANTEYCLFELNGSPGMGVYAALGPHQKALVRALYRKMFDTPLIMLSHYQSNTLSK